MKAILAAILAVALIGVGVWREFLAPEVSASDQARCESILREKYAGSAAGDEAAIASLIEACKTAGMVAMMDAEKAGASAQGAAGSIAAANRSDLVSTLINCALIGAGIGALGAAASYARRRA